MRSRRTSIHDILTGLDIEPRPAMEEGPMDGERLGDWFDRVVGRCGNPALQWRSKSGRESSGCDCVPRRYRVMRMAGFFTATCPECGAWTCFQIQGPEPDAGDDASTATPTPRAESNH